MSWSSYRVQPVSGELFCGGWVSSSLFSGSWFPPVTTVTIVTVMDNSKRNCVTGHTQATLFPLVNSLFSMDAQRVCSNTHVQSDSPFYFRVWHPEIKNMPTFGMRQSAPHVIGVCRIGCTYTWQSESRGMVRGLHWWESSCRLYILPFCNAEIM